MADITGAAFLLDVTCVHWIGIDSGSGMGRSAGTHSCGHVEARLRRRTCNHAGEVNIPAESVLELAVDRLVAVPACFGRRRRPFGQFRWGGGFTCLLCPKRT